MAINKTSVKDIEKNFAKFDLALICEDKYKELKHIDMVVYTMLKNQESLSVSSVKNGNNRYVDKNGFIFISVSQEKLSKILKTTRPTLKASLDRLVKCELIEVLTIGNMKCNRIYVGNAESTIALGEYISRIGTELDEEVEEFKPSINVKTLEEVKESKKASNVGAKEATQKSKKINNSNKSISQNNKNYAGKNNKFNAGTRNKCTEYDEETLNKMLEANEARKNKRDNDRRNNEIKDECIIEEVEKVEEVKIFVPSIEGWA